VGKKLRDMPAPALGVIGDMANYLVRDDLVTNGCSTCTYNDGYIIENALVFRRPPEQNPLAIDFSDLRDINIDKNVKYNYKIMETLYLKNKTLVNDSDIVTVTNTIKPKTWKAILFSMFDELVKLAVIADPDYSKASTVVAISGTDPKRINTTFFYKRTGTADKTATIAKAGFNFGG
jgi:hypothetical protein